MREWQWSCDVYFVQIDEVVQLIHACDTIADIWKAIQDIYLHEGDFAQIHELYVKAFKLT